MQHMKFRLKQILKMFSQHIIFPFLYMINRWRRIDDRLVVFADAHHDSIPPHMELLYTELSSGPYRTVQYFHDLSGMTAWQSLRCMAGFMRLYAAAAYVVICDNYLPVASCRKKKATVVIQLWHGCGAFKRFGYDAEDDIPGCYHGNVYKNYDVVTVSGNSCVAPFAHAMRMEHERIVPVGVSNTDKFFDNEYIHMCRDKFRYIHPDASGRQVLLWAPTFRGNAGTAGLYGEEYIDMLASDRELSESIYVIKSVHPHLQREAEMTTEELLVCADILITDYSSVFFEYLLMDKPIIFFAPDYRNYIKKRGFYMDYDSLPGYVIKGTGHDKNNNMDIFLAEELKCTIANILKSDTMENLRAICRKKYMSGCDGASTKRIIERYFR